MNPYSEHDTISRTFRHERPVSVLVWVGLVLLIGGWLYHLVS